MSLRENLQLENESGTVDLILNHFRPQYGRFSPKTQDFRRHEGHKKLASLPKNQSAHTGEKGACLICGKTAHYARHSPSKYNMRETFKSRLQQGIPTVRMVYEFFLSLESKLGNEQKFVDDGTYFSSKADHFNELCVDTSSSDDIVKEDSSPENLEKKIATDHVGGALSTKFYSLFATGSRNF